ncbi:MAG: peptidyl-prolyl cis-trans isomerase [candidate division KSB1 bacterium]|nr:peptidyl-prolyl cis-trans isomerase [candidate division KSB1 bacterium]MDZ7392348.1 peptidyl-prolyl cis-trans isomerase [candidate division KSB1 bacterium]
MRRVRERLALLVGALVLIGAVLGFISLGCGGGEPGDQRVVARVGGSVLRLADLKAAFPDNPRLGISEAQVRSYVQRWINTELLAQEAQRRGLAHDPKVRRQLANSRREVLAAAILEQEAMDSVSIAEEELQAYFEKNRDAFCRTEEEYLLQEILVPTWQEATELRMRILNGESFERLAQERSQAATAVQGGSTGYVRRTQMPPEVAQQLPRAPLGRVLSPIKTEAGYYVLKVVDTKPAGSARDFADVRDLVRERVAVEKTRGMQRQLLSRLRARQPVYVDYDLLAQLVPDSTRGASLPEPARRQLERK